MTIRTKVKIPYLVFPWQLKLKAHQRIVRFKMAGDELALNKFIEEAYHTSLKLMCIKLLNNSTIDISDGEFVIYFNSKKWDRLATLITYGNGKTNGSKILQNAFLN